MAKEIERRGVPVALISALPEFVAGLGVGRIVKGVRIEHVCGDPRLSRDEDLMVRRRIVETALLALNALITEPTLFEPALVGSGTPNLMPA
jgi:glycine/betaine/sarcosine/D-proline reductase family selenoprotein B